MGKTIFPLKGALDVVLTGCELGWITPARSRKVGMMSMQVENDRQMLPGAHWAKEGNRMIRGTRIPPSVVCLFASLWGEVEACAQRGPYQQNELWLPTFSYELS